MLRSPIFWGIIATAVYFCGLFGFYFFFGKFPLKKLDLNEVGDFFAGAFAPLAFFWLVVAVFLQRQELSAQRKQLSQQSEELRLSREELKLNRELLQEQGEELRQQSDNLRKQVSIAESTNLIGSLELEIESIIRKIDIENAKCIWDKSHLGRVGIHRHTVSPIKKMLADDQFAEAARTIIQHIHNVRGQDKNRIVSFGEFQDLYKQLNLLKGRIYSDEMLSKAFEAYEIDAMFEGLGNLVEIEIEFYNAQTRL